MLFFVVALPYPIFGCVNMKKSFCKVISFLIVCVFLLVTFSMVAFAIEEVGIKHIFVNQISGRYASSVSGESIVTNREDTVILKTSEGSLGYGMNYSTVSINNVTGVTLNAYFQGENIIVDHYYKISFYTFMPYEKAVKIVNGEYNANTYTLKVGWWHAYLLDSSKNIRLNKSHYDSNVVWHDQLQPPSSDDYGLEIRTSYDNIGNAKFIFFPFEFVFCASDNYTLHHLNFSFSCLPEFVFGNSGGFYGISDFYIEDITDVPIKITNSLDDINDNLESITNAIYNIPNTMQGILHYELLLLFNNQKGFLKDYLDSIKETNDKLTSSSYSTVDDSAINSHNQLADKIESDTASGRDVAVDTIMNVAEDEDDTYVNLFKGMMVWSEIIDEGLSEFDWYDGLVDFSLAVGLYGFLLGLAIYAVGKISSGRSRSKGSKPKYRKKG